MIGLLIVELTSTQIRFLKLQKSANSPISAIQSLKFNKKITNNIKNIEVQRIDTIIKNNLKKAVFSEINRKNWLFYRSESFPPMVLSDINPIPFNYLSKKIHFAIKNKTLKDEIKFIFYDGIVYIAYYNKGIFFYRTFINACELKDLSQFEDIFAHRLLMFDLNKKASLITVIFDNSFKNTAVNLTFLKEYFAGVQLKRFFIPFIEYIYDKP